MLNRRLSLHYKSKYLFICAGRIAGGTGPNVGEDELVSWQDGTPIEVNFMAISNGDGRNGTWEFANLGNTGGFHYYSKNVTFSSIILIAVFFIDELSPVTLLNGGQLFIFPTKYYHVFN